MEAIMPRTAFLPETFCTTVKKVMLSAAGEVTLQNYGMPTGADPPAMPDTFSCGFLHQHHS